MNNQSLAKNLQKIVILHLLKMERPTKQIVNLYKETIYDLLNDANPIDARIKATIDYWTVYYTEGVTR